MAKDLRPGEARWVCASCGALITTNPVTTVGQVKCRCGCIRVRALKKRPTSVSGIGRNKRADLGMALLREAQEKDDN